MYRYSGRQSKLRKFFLLLILTSLIFFVIIMYISVKMRPLIKPIAIANARSIATRSINDAVNEEIPKLGITYDKLITFDKDNNSRITALRANTIEINKLQSQLTVAVLNKISKITESKVSIPVGNLIDSGLFSNRGPKITLKLIPVGYASSEIKSRFEAAGINQTRHEILLQVKATIGVILPTSTEYAEVNTQITLAESIIVGEVPDTYTDINGDTGDLIDKYNNYAK